MATVIVKRPQRRPEPPYPSGDILLEPPPELPKPSGRGWGQIVMLLPMLAGSVAMALMFAGQRGGPFAYVTGGLFGLSAIGMLASQLGQHAGGASKQEMMRSRRNYLRHLAQQRRRAQQVALDQRRTMFYRHPNPDTLWAIVDSPRLWERRPGDGDYLSVRIGLGRDRLAASIVPPPAKPLEDVDPMCALALRRFITTHTEVENLPLVMALDGFSRVHVTGDRDAVRGMIQAVLAQVAAFHAPDDVLVAVAAAPEHRPGWEWLKWLPHSLHPTKTDAVGQRRLVSTTVADLEALLDDVIGGRPRYLAKQPDVRTSHPHVIVILDGGDTIGSKHLLVDSGLEGVTVIDLSSPAPSVVDRSTLVLDISAEGRLAATTYDGRSEIGRPDHVETSLVESLALALAPRRLSVASRQETPAVIRDLDLTELLNIGDPTTFDVRAVWSGRGARNRLRVPIGVTPTGAPVELDLKESALDGMGPHGLLIGATGSGKSELLRTLVLGLALTHSSETLNFVLIDFKGGATFTKLDALPHTSAVITNLADELPLVDRMNDAIDGELYRRQELLRRAGDFKSVHDYEQARAAGAPLAPLPSLLIVCDEFSELLTRKPEFIELFLKIGRVGRSLGIHLLLASQQLEEGRLRGLDTHLSYRIGLRTFSAMESRVVLGDTVAYELPRAPGHGYLRFGTEPLVRFKAAYVSGPYRPPGAPESGPASADVRVEDYTTSYIPRPVETVRVEQAPAETADTSASLLDIVVARLAGQGPPAHQVWLPPLKEAIPLNEIVPDLVVTADRGITVEAAHLRGALRIPVGLVDRPFEQRRDGLWLDLSGSGGHAVVVGGPQSGKSTFLRTLIVGIALTHTPREAQIYCLDFGGGSLASVRDLPHVGTVASRLDTGTVRRTVAEVHQVLREREARFTSNAIDSMATYRRRRAAGEFADDPFGDVFLVIDGWSTIRSEFDDLEPQLADLVARGLSFGIHVVATASQWMDLRPAVRDAFGTRLELRLGDPSSSALDRRIAANVPENAPGRGLTPEKLHFLTALPRIDQSNRTDDLPDALAQLAQDMRQAWPGPGAPAVRLLPTMFPYSSLPPATVGAQRGLPVGIAESDLGPVWLDLTSESHFLVFGDTECGKSTFLRVLAQSIVDRHPINKARIILVDYRRSLLGSITTEHLIGYGTSAQTTQTIMNEVVGVMRARLPGPDVTPAQLRERSWWKGPDLYLLVDDYDLVAGTANPLLPLVEFLGQARDIGLHVVVTRRSGGASRAMFDPLLMRLKELGSPGLVMSGDRNEGVLLGNVKPSKLPPGRGWLVTRREGARLIQVAWLPPPE